MHSLVVNAFIMADGLCVTGRWRWWERVVLRCAWRQHSSVRKHNYKVFLYQFDPLCRDFGFISPSAQHGPIARKVEESAGYIIRYKPAAVASSSATLKVKITHQQVFSRPSANHEALAIDSLRVVLLACCFFLIRHNVTCCLRSVLFNYWDNLIGICI